jgi:hypothetical protein
MQPPLESYITFLREGSKYSEDQQGGDVLTNLLLSVDRGGNG